MRYLATAVLLSALLAQCVSGQLRISGGKMGLPGQFPYQALIRAEGDNSIKCAGALINPEWVLTSASCIHKPVVFEVILGAFDISLSTEETRQTTLVASNHIHEDYNPETGENDIALVRLNTSAVENDFVAYIRLPSKNQVSKSFLAWRGSVAGWGNEQKGVEGNANVVLRWFDSLVAPNFWCKFRLGSNLFRENNNICVSGFFWKKGACAGDEGSPLAVTESDDKPTLLGIASNDASACSNFKPVVFTKVTPYLDWINQRTEIKLRL